MSGGGRAVSSHFDCEDVDVIWQVERIEFTEALNETYRGVLRLRTQNSSPVPTDLLGKPVSFTLERDHHVRTIHGVVTEVAATVPLYDTGHAHGCAIVVEPALALLRLRSDTRHFLGKTVPEMIQDTCERHLLLDRASNVHELLGTYLAREYTVQYDESPLAFIHRLAEGAGLGYAFDHEDGSETLSFYDRNPSYPELDSGDGSTLLFSPVGSSTGLDREHVSSFLCTHTLVPTRVAVSDWNWTNPGAPPEDDDEADEEEAHELFHHVNPLSITGYGSSQYEEHDAAEQALIRREEAMRDAAVAKGMGTVIGMEAGHRFMLEGHPTDHGEYLLTSVTHTFDAAQGDGQGSYSNHFRALPIASPYRPKRVTALPIARTQSALVVGRTPERTTDTDCHGRVFVQFHWDRLSDRNERSSAPVRVSHPWAGPGMGAQFIPRVGQEVLVAFLHGDPDRPYVAGRVYNGDNTVPMDAPDGETASTTQSGIRTQGVEDPARFNEFRFDDAHGEEEVYLHAQHNLLEEVQNNHTTAVHANHTNTVDGNDTEIVGGDQALTVRQDRTHTVEGHETVEVQKTRTTDIREDETHRTHMNRSFTVTENETYTIEGNRTSQVKGETRARHGMLRETRVTGDESLHVDANTLMRLLGELLVHSDLKLELRQSTTEHMIMDGSIEVSSQSRLRLVVPGATFEMTEGTLRVTVDNAIELVANGSTIRIGPEGGVSIDGESVVTVGAGTGTVTLDQSGTAITGATVTAVGDTAAEVAGNSVSIN